MNFGQILGSRSMAYPDEAMQTKLGSDWSVWLHSLLVFKQSWDLIGQHNCVCSLSYMTVPDRGVDNFFDVGGAEHIMHL